MKYKQTFQLLNLSPKSADNRVYGFDFQGKRHESILDCINDLGNLYFNCLDDQTEQAAQ